MYYISFWIVFKLLLKYVEKWQVDVYYYYLILQLGKQLDAQ